MKLSSTDSLSMVSKCSGVDISHLVTMDALFASLKVEGIFVKKNDNCAIQIGYKVGNRYFYGEYGDRSINLHSLCDRVVRNCPWIKSLTVFLTGNKDKPLRLTMYTNEGGFHDKFRQAKDVISYLEAFLSE